MLRRFLLLGAFLTSAGKTEVNTKEGDFLPYQEIDSQFKNNDHTRQLLGDNPTPSSTVPPEVEEVKSALEDNNKFLGALVTIGTVGYSTYKLSKRLAGDNRNAAWCYKKKAKLVRAGQSACFPGESSAMTNLKDAVSAGNDVKVFALLETTHLESGIDTGYTGLHLMIKNNKENLSCKTLKYVAGMATQDTNKANIIGILKRLNIKDRDKEGTKALENTPLLLAVRKKFNKAVFCFYDILIPLLQHNDKDIKEAAFKFLKEKNHGGYTVMGIAAKFGNWEVVDATLKLGIDKDGKRISEIDDELLDLLSIATTDNGTSPLMGCAAFLTVKSRTNDGLKERTVATLDDRKKVFDSLLEFLLCMTRSGDINKMVKALDIIKHRGARGTTKDYLLATLSNEKTQPAALVIYQQMLTDLNEAVYILEVAIGAKRLDQRIAEVAEAEAELETLKNVKHTQVSVSPYRQLEIKNERVAAAEAKATIAGLARDRAQNELDELSKNLMSAAEEKSSNVVTVKFSEQALISNMNKTENKTDFVTLHLETPSEKDNFAKVPQRSHLGRCALM